MTAGKRVVFIILLLVALLAVTNVQGRELRILYVNDFHGFASGGKVLSSGKAEGGIARLAGLADRLRREKPSLFLSAGDMIQGDNWANLFFGKPVVEVMNLMGFDAMVLGNHEFDFGTRVLEDLIRDAQFPVLAGNVEGLKGLKPYIVKEVNGLKVAIIGVVTEDTGIYTNPKNVKGVMFLSQGASVLKWLDELKNKTDLVLVLSHIGYGADMELARNVKGIDVIVGGHSHTRLETPVRVGKTVIVQAWEYGRVLGVLDLDIEDGQVIEVSGRLEPIEEWLPENGAVGSVVEVYRRKIEGRMNEVIGETSADLDGSGVRTEETNLGDLVADIIRESSGSDVAILNGGSIRRDIGKGIIRLGDIYSTLPFDSYVVSVALSGRELIQVLEHGVSAVEEKEGRFPQVSWLSFLFSRAGLPGSRIKGVTVGGKPINEDKVYSVATNDFLASGGDGYTTIDDVLHRSGGFSNVGGVLKSNSILYSNPGKWIRDEVADYIRGKGVISAKKERRIVEEREGKSLFPENSRRANAHLSGKEARTRCCAQGGEEL